MGTINYMTSDYITLGFDLSAYDVTDYGNWEEMTNSLDYDCNESYEDVKFLLGEYRFDNFKISAEYGYYDGFYIALAPYYDYYYTAEELPNVIAECLRLGECLTTIAGTGLVSCYPGWCTGYATAAETAEEINQAVVDMINDILGLVTSANI